MNSQKIIDGLQDAIAGRVVRVTTYWPHHEWIACEAGEPFEEGGKCRNCGAWATSEEFIVCSDPPAWEIT